MYSVYSYCLLVKIYCIIWWMNRKNIVWFVIRKGGSETFQDKQTYFCQEVRKFQKSSTTILKIDRSQLLYSVSGFVNSIHQSYFINYKYDFILYWTIKDLIIRMQDDTWKHYMHINLNLRCIFKSFILPTVASELEKKWFHLYCSHIEPQKALIPATGSSLSKSASQGNKVIFLRRKFHSLFV